PHRRAARQSIEADSGDRDLRRRGRHARRSRRAARAQGAARFESAVERGGGVEVTSRMDTGKSGVPITIRRVSKVFGEDTDNPFQALKAIGVDIEAGEFVSVVGPSGCGKSTLMLMVAGLLHRSGGDIVIDGRTVVKPITDVGIAFQDHLLLEFRTAFDNVMLHADIRKLPRKQVETRATELFAQLRLTEA